MLLSTSAGVGGSAVVGAGRGGGGIEERLEDITVLGRIRPPMELKLIADEPEALLEPATDIESGCKLGEGRGGGEFPSVGTDGGGPVGGVCIRGTFPI